MTRFALAILVLAALVVATVSCSKEPSPSSGAAPTAGEAAKTAVPETAKSLDPKALISDDKISRFVIYQKEMNSVADLAMAAGIDALKDSGGSQKAMEKALAKDGRAQKIVEAQASALSKSGLTQTEANEISNVLTPYIAGFTIGDDEMKSKSREEMKSKYGPEAVSTLEKHLPELSKLQDELLAKTLGKKK